MFKVHISNIILIQYVKIIRNNNISQTGVKLSVNFGYITIRKQRNKAIFT